MSVDLVASTDYGRVRSVLVVPNAVTHHNDWLRTLLIVLVGQQATDPGLHAKGPEKISGHEFSIARIHRRLGSYSAHTKWSVAGLQCGKVFELRRLGAEMLVCLPRKEGEIAIVALCVATPVAAANFISDPPQRAWVGHGQRLQHHLVNQSEDRGGRSDAERQCDQNCCRKTRSLSQLPHGVTQIGEHLSPRMSFDVARRNPLLPSFP